MKRIAGIDVHKKMLVAVIAAAESPDQVLQKHKFGAARAELERLRQWLGDAAVEEVVMESTAQYWRPVWNALEEHFSLHLAHAQSNRAPHGRKSDWADARRLVKRLAAGELFLSFVPEPEQRDWRMLTRARQALVRDHVHLQNQVEALLEPASIKLSSVVSDLFGVSGLRILWALAQAPTDPETLADLADARLRCGREVLVDALRGQFRPVHRQLLDQAMQRLRTISEQIGQLNQLAAQRMQPHTEAIQRLIEVPGIGAEAAQEILAEIGPAAAAFSSSAQLASWIGVCPGTQESAGENHSGRCAKGTPTFAACSVQWLTPPSTPKAVISRRYFASSCTRDTTKPSGRWLTNSVRSSGTSSTTASAISSMAKLLILRPSNEPSNTISRH